MTAALRAHAIPCLAIGNCGQSVAATEIASEKQSNMNCVQMKSRQVEISTRQGVFIKQQSEASRASTAKAEHE
jgi:hypothetical protein